MKVVLEDNYEIPAIRAYKNIMPQDSSKLAFTIECQETCVEDILPHISREKGAVTPIQIVDDMNSVKSYLGWEFSAISEDITPTGESTRIVFIKTI